MEQRVSELEHFTGRVAHDVRSPLASVGLALSLAERNTTDPKMLGILGRGSRTLQRVGQLVDGLLVFAHAGAPPTSDSHSNAAEVIRGVLEDMRPVADEKEVDLRAESGLATVRRLAEADGGGVGVEGRKPGSLFWFELPTADPAQFAEP